MPRHLFAILDDLTSNLAELKATLAPLALIGGTVVGRSQEARLGATSREGGAFRRERAAQRAQVKKLRAAKRVDAAIALAKRLRP